MKAWYFSNTDKQLRFEDGRKIRKGVTHKVKGDIVLCENGLHGSPTPLKALEYAPGPVVWRVELSGDLVRADDKVAARCRKYLWGFDATDVLQDFARQCALDVAHLWDAPDVVLQYLRTGDPALRVAAGDAAGDAALAAARAAAWAAGAVGDAARAAAWAAGVAAGDAAWDAARAKQSRRLTRMINAEAKRRGFV